MRSGKSGRPSRPKSLLYDTWFQFRARWHDAAGLLEGCSGKERSIAWAGRFRQQAAARAARLAPGGPAVVPPTSYARGEVVRAGAKLAKQRAAPRTGVEREEEVAAAIERITRMPTERVAALQEMPCGSGASMPPGLLAFQPATIDEFNDWCLLGRAEIDALTDCDCPFALLAPRNSANSGWMTPESFDRTPPACVTAHLPSRHTPRSRCLPFSFA
jgi:hypothetical protein